MAQELSPPGSVFGRIGGEEFACLFPATSPGGPACAVERIREAFSKVTVQVIPSLRATVSVGIATTAECGRELDTLLWRADEALYLAKALGRDRVHVFAKAGFEPAPALPRRRARRDAA